MGGHAFQYLPTPRISSELYLKTKEWASAQLKPLFKQVLVAYELPNKTDHGDIDFLVAAPLKTTQTDPKTFDWRTTINDIKDAFGTKHGYASKHNTNVIYFAVPALGREGEFHIQIDIKICFRPDMFHWDAFQLHYASLSKIIGSIMKPLGLTLDQDGMHIRVQEMEKMNFPGSMVWLSKDPADVLSLLAVDDRLLTKGFKTDEEIFEWIASSWLFNPLHFVERLKAHEYYNRLHENAPQWVQFVFEWMPSRYPGLEFPKPYNLRPAEGDSETSDAEKVATDIQDPHLTAWRKNLRPLAREKAFEMLPTARATYEEKRRVFIREVEEKRLRELIRGAIPVGQEGWVESVKLPRVTYKPAEPQAVGQLPTTGVQKADSTLTMFVKGSEPTPPASPIMPPETLLLLVSDDPLSNIDTMSPACLNDLLSTPLILETLSRNPPMPHIPKPPPGKMSEEAKLLCVARWTMFTANGTPYLAQEPREKGFQMDWASSNASDEVLLRWTQDMWWPIWIRQGAVNWVGMWKKQFQKDDTKKAKEAVEEDSQWLREAIKAGTEDKNSVTVDALQSRVDDDASRMATKDRRLAVLRTLDTEIEQMAKR